jgi:hypothetical protein
MGAQMILLRDDLVAMKLLGPLEVGLGHRQLCLCLKVGRVRFTDFQTVEHGQRLPGLHLIAEIRLDLDDAPRHSRSDMRDAILVGADGGGHRELLADFLRFGRFLPS